MAEGEAMSNENILRLAAHMNNLKPEEYDQTSEEHSCGTPACIAGHAAYLAGQWGYGAPQPFAKEWLDLSWRSAYDLFDPIPYGAANLTPTPQDAARTLRYLAETGKVDWWRERDE